MSVNFNSQYVGQLSNKEQSAYEDRSGLVHREESFDLNGQNKHAKFDPSSRMHIDSTQLDHYTKDSDGQRIVKITDTDKNPNLSVKVSNNGDVNISNPGNNGSAEYTLENALPHQMAIDAARKAIANAGRQISSVDVTYGKNQNESFGELAINTRAVDNNSSDQAKYAARFQVSSRYTGVVKGELYNFAARVGLAAEDIELKRVPGGGLMTPAFELHATGPAESVEKFKKGVTYEIDMQWAVPDSFQTIPAT